MRGHPQAGSFGFQLTNLNTCFADLQARHAELGLRWLFFPDVDEFVLSNHKDQLLTDLSNKDYGDVACMEVARTFYGTSFYHRRPPQGLVTENYLLASPDYESDVAVQSSAPATEMTDNGHRLGGRSRYYQSIESCECKRIVFKCGT